MALNLDPECQNAVDLAKRAVPPQAELDLLTLLAALYHSSDLKSRYPDWAAALPLPQNLPAETPEKVSLAAPLQPIFKRLAQETDPISVEELFLALIAAESSRASLLAQGLTEEQLNRVQQELTPALTGWRQAAERSQAIAALSSFGRMLTATEPPLWQVVGQDKVLQAIVRTLSKMDRRNAIFVGYPGTGKSAVI